MTTKTSLSMLRDADLATLRTKPSALPYFEAYLFNPQNGLTSEVVTKVNLTTTRFNSGNHFDTTQSRFQPTVAGIYYISGIIKTNGTGITYTNARLYKNGAWYASSPEIEHASTTGDGASAECIVSMNGTTDYIELMAAIKGTTINLNTGASVTGLRGFLIDQL